MTSMTAFFGFLIGFFFLGSLYMLYKNNRQYNKPFVEFLTEMLIMLILMIFICKFITGGENCYLNLLR